MRLAHIQSDTPGGMNQTLRALADAMLARGAQVVGAVQINSDADEDDSCDMNLRLLPHGPMVCISQRLGEGSEGCRLDPGQLENAVEECNRRLAAGADLLIVNKFGSHEAEGRGFRDLVATALTEDVAVVIGVSEAKLAEFQEFAGDLATPLPCDLAALEAWCTEAPRDA